MADCYADALSRQDALLPGALEAVRRWSAKVPVVIVTSNGPARMKLLPLSKLQAMKPSKNYWTTKEILYLSLYGLSVVTVGLMISVMVDLTTLLPMN